MEKKRLFARCLSQLRRLHGMKYDLHPIALIQTLLLRESQKGKHLSAQESSEWSRRMYQLSLTLDQRETDEMTTVTDDDDPPPLFSPTLTKAKSFLGGSWASNRRSSETTVVSLPIESSSPTNKPAPLRPVNIPSTIPFESNSSSPPPSPRRQISSESVVHIPQSLISPSPDENQLSQSVVPKKNKGFKKLLNVMKFKTKVSGSPSDSLSVGPLSDEKVDSPENRLTPPESQRSENLNPKSTRRMIL
jgi:hypothetical protein